MQEFFVRREDAGQTSFKFVKRILNKATDGFIYKEFRKKNIVLNGKKMTGKETVSFGDSVKIFMTDSTIDNFSGRNGVVDTSEFLTAFGKVKDLKSRIIYEDDDFIFFNKPANMLSQKDEKDSFSVNEALIGYLLDENKITPDSLSFFKPSVCNRLDRNTGGIISFGKTLHGVNYLNKVFKERTVEKWYLTIVKGRIDKEARVSAFILKDEKANKVKVSDSKLNGEYKEIETEYVPVKYDKEKDITLLHVHLITGKSHQIRAHLSYLGHPVIGDRKYGGADIFPELKSQFLYAVKLIFPENDDNSLSGKTISIPEDDLIKDYY